MLEWKMEKFKLETALKTLHTDHLQDVEFLLLDLLLSYIFHNHPISQLKKSNHLLYLIDFLSRLSLICRTRV